MIASLRGIVIDKGLDYVVIECAGVGYQCAGTATTIAELLRGEEVFVTTAMVVREDSQTLYVFKDADEKRAFNTLQSVSGVGARLALAILSVVSPAELAVAVSNGDHKTLQKAPGVGKRLAERMAVDLKGKVADFGDPAGQPAHPAPAGQSPRTSVNKSSKPWWDWALPNRRRTRPSTACWHSGRSRPRPMPPRCCALPWPR